MKKFLLLALVMFSMNSFAQNSNVLSRIGNYKNLKSVKFNTQSILKDLVASGNAVSPTRAMAKAPDGTKSIYYLDCYESTLYGIEYLCNKNHKTSEIIVGSDGKAYISNMFYTSIFGDDLYLEGEFDSDGNIEIGYQKLAVSGEYTLYVCKINLNNSEADKVSTFKLNYDKENNVYYSDDSNYLGVYVEYQGKLILDTYSAYFTYYPENVFPAPTEHSYSYVDYNNKTNNTTVKMIDLGEGYFYVNNIMPNYPDTWMLGMFDNNNMIIFSYQTATDYIAYMFSDADGYFQDNGTLAYNSLDNTYKLNSNSMLIDIIYDSQQKQYMPYSNILTNMAIGASTTGISKVENGNENVVSTNYYDLSGRRINGASKGISIKVMKYADGTSKAVKVMK